jgi:hypothetical protein
LVLLDTVSVSRIYDPTTTTLSLIVTGRENHEMCEGTGLMGVEFDGIGVKVNCKMKGLAIQAVCIRRSGD